MKLWAGRFSKEIDQKTNDFNSSIKFDSRMIEEDIKGSIAHATMLGACGIIEQSEAEHLEGNCEPGTEREAGPAEYSRRSQSAVLGHPI